MEEQQGKVCRNCNTKIMWAWDKMYNKWLMLEWDTPVFAITRGEEGDTKSYATWAKGHKVKHKCKE